MNNRKYFLKENVQAEPLVGSWPAWPHIIAPATAAMNVLNSHVKIMKSFVMAPDVHTAALKNPTMRGGPFIEYNKRRVGEVKALLEKTTKERAHMLKFAEAVKKLSDLLDGEARGYSLESFYQQVPEELRGYVELVYNLSNYPTIRFMEGLLYKSDFYNSAWQSIVLSFVKRDERPFMFSTPRLMEDGELHLNLPFNHSGLDELFKMRETPQTLGHIKEAIGLADEDDALFENFLTEDSPYKCAKRERDSLRARYFGHACVLIETERVSILTDPVISYRFDTELPRQTFADLPERIDYVLITHNHSDHIVLETLLQLRHKIRNIIVPKSGGGALEDPSLKLVLKTIGFENVYEIDEMESIPVDGGAITSLPFLGEHCDLNIRSKNAYHVRINNRSMIFAADSANLEHKLYEHIHKVIGDVDALFLGMECDGAPLTWVYGGLLTRHVDRKMDQSRRLSGSDYEKASKIVKILNCKKVYVYAMGMEPWLSHIMALQYTNESKPIVESDRLIKECRERGIYAERLYVAKDNLV
jgi:L-ascorbate metabolism protein UlaG (beta-lactamase superfamily)